MSKKGIATAEGRCDHKDHMDESFWCQPIFEEVTRFLSI